MKIKKSKQSDLCVIQHTNNSIKIRGVPANKLLELWLNFQDSYTVSFCNITRRNNYEKTNSNRIGKHDKNKRGSNC